MRQIEINPVTGDQYPVLVYRYPYMTDEQAKAIQDFVQQIMEQGTVIPTKDGDAIGFDDMPPELRLQPDELIGEIVPEQFAAACGRDFRLVWDEVG